MLKNSRWKPFLFPVHLSSLEYQVQPGKKRWGSAVWG